MSVCNNSHTYIRVSRDTRDKLKNLYDDAGYDEAICRLIREVQK